jgi:aldehyde dehydrogenase (NAD+)
MKIAGIAAQLRDNFNRGITRSHAYRDLQLENLQRFVVDNEQLIIDALRADLGKSETEAVAMEIGMISSEIRLARKMLHKWMKPKKVSTPLLVQPGASYIYPEPLGVVLIIGPWNFPFQLTIIPLIGALAAGNCVVLKPSEVAPATSQLLARVLPNYLDQEGCTIVEGGVAETTALLDQHFDHILYTGNGAVGRIVMTAAAKNLTPVTLELGGKSPCIVDATTNLELAARRIAWGKFSNAGQSCIAPDYILVEHTVEKALLEQLKIAIHQFYGDNPQTSADYGRIINEHHFQRLMQMLPGSGDVYVGGESDEAKRYISPTIITNVPVNAPIMADEIFGPILPVIAVKNIDAAIAFVNARPKPLSLNIFSNSEEVRQDIIQNTSSGSVAINYPMMQAAVPALPFGGVGASGMGAYHGKFSFDTFTHFKAVLKKPIMLDLSMMYPPYSKLFLKMLRWLQ